MLRTLAVLCVLLCSSLAQDPTLSARFGTPTVLSASPLYEMYRNVTGDRITFAVRVETEGWVGFGISPTGLMLSSDVVMGFVDDDTGAVTIRVSGYNSSDGLGPANGIPSVLASCLLAICFVTATSNVLLPPT